jgi:hypothetical protein
VIGAVDLFRLRGTRLSSIAAAWRPTDALDRRSLSLQANGAVAQCAKPLADAPKKAGRLSDGNQSCRFDLAV